MKKALVLGVLAIFAINIATVQTVNAQDKNNKKEAKKEKKEAKKVVKPAAASWDTEKGGGRSSVNQTKGTETKTVESKKAAQTVEKKATTPNASKNVKKDSDPTQKNKRPEIGVPPTPDKEKAPKKSTTNTNNGGDSK